MVIGNISHPATDAARPELLVASVLHLMSHYTAHAGERGVCIRLASVIERHFQALAALPDLAPVLRATCIQLAEQWALLVERSVRQHDDPVPVPVAQGPSVGLMSRLGRRFRSSGCQSASQNERRK